MRRDGGEREGGMDGVKQTESEALHWGMSELLNGLSGAQGNVSTLLLDRIGRDDTACYKMWHPQFAYPKIPSDTMIPLQPDI